MASITITIPDEQVNRVVHALCYSPVAGEGVEETPANAKQKLIEYIKIRVRDVELDEARQSVQQPDTTGIAS